MTPPFKRAVCRGCRTDTLLHPHAGGWVCPDCRHVTGTDAPPPPKNNRRYNRQSTPLPLDEAVRAVQMYRAGEGSDAIAKALCRDRRRVTLTLELHGAELRRRGGSKPRDVCRNGLHELTEDNVVWSYNQRRCRACRAESLRRSKERLRLRAEAHAQAREVRAARRRFYDDANWGAA